MLDTEVTMKHFTDYSFLYPAGTPKPDAAASDPEIAVQLGLDRLFTTDVLPYFTSDAAILDYRAQLFRDLDTIPEARAFLTYFREQVDILEDICRDGGSDDTESCVRDLVLLTVYTGLIRTARAALAELPLRSDALLRLRDLLGSIAEDEDFRRLADQLAHISVDIESIKSITVGINLDAQLRPREAGVVAIHREYFKSGEWIDRLLRMELTRDEYTCLAPLTPLSGTLTAQEREQIDAAINGALNKIFRRSVKLARGSSVRTLRAWCRELTPLRPELSFLTDACRLIETLRDRGGALCYPTYTDDGRTAITGLYNPHLLLTMDSPAVVRNSITVNPDRRIFLITGPNSGGKTVFTVAVALCTLFAGLGLPLPATRATITPAAAIKVHFPARGKERHQGGRLEEECRRLAEIQKSLLPNTAVFMDETFSSTGAEEAAILAARFLDHLRKSDCTCLFSTHLHALARTCHGKDGYVSLSAVPNAYRIEESAPDGMSYAEKIAQSYGLA